MSWSEVVAVFAAFVAALSALYARWSAKASQRANEIAIHNERLRIYRGLLDFRAMLTTRGPGFPDEELWKFGDIVLLSEFYFSQSAHKALVKLLEDGNQIKARYDLWQHQKETKDGDWSKAAKSMHDLHRATRDQCSVVAEMLKPDLLLEVSKPRWLI